MQQSDNVRLDVRESSSSGSATGNPRNKVALKPGRSLMDWIRLTHSGKDLTGVGGKMIPITYQELQKHNKEGDAWICLKGCVYNVSDYMEYHPGGICELMKGVGKDATKLFNETHQWVNYESMLQKCLVGQIVERSLFDKSIFRYLPKRPGKSQPRPPDNEQITSVDIIENEMKNQPAKCYKCTLSAKYPVNHNTHLFKLNLPQGVCLSIPIGHHVQIKTLIKGVEVLRNYTPVISSFDCVFKNAAIEDVEQIYLMIKIYEDGTVTPYLDSVLLGGEIELVNQVLGNFDVTKFKNCKRHILLAAGTGLTPMIRLIHFTLNRSVENDVQVKLVFFNRDEKDILWREELDNLMKANSRLDVEYILSDPHENWSGERARVNKGLLETLLPFCNEDFCGVCGPIGFTDEVMRILKDLNFPILQIHQFKS